MLRDFNNLNGVWPVFLSSDYFCDIHGNLYDRFKRIIELDCDSEGNLGKVIDLWGHKKFYKIGGLVSTFFKSVKIHNSLLHILDVMHLDGNKENNHAGNLIWKFPSGGLRHPRYKDFSYIPGYSKYIINKNGVLIDHKEDIVIEPFFEELYAKFRVYPDVGFRVATSRHRLLSLAWIDYPAFVDDLVVNHKNGIRGDDREENLEFISRRENNIHASELGLTSKGREVLVKNYETDTIMTFRGTTECARYFNLNRSTVKYRLHSGQQIYPGNIVFKYANDSTPWREDLTLTTKSLNKGDPRSIKAKNVFTDEIQTFSSIKKAGDHLKIHPNTIHGYLKNSISGRPTNGFVFKYFVDDSPWPSYTDSEKALFKKYPIGKNLGLKIENIKTGEIILFSDVKELKEKFNLNTGQLNDFRYHQKLINETFRYVPQLKSINSFN